MATRARLAMGAAVALLACALAAVARHEARVEGGAVALAAVAAGAGCHFELGVQDESESGQRVQFGGEGWCSGSIERRGMLRVGDREFALGPPVSRSLGLNFSEVRYSADARHWLVFGSGENGEPGHWRHLYRSDDGGDTFVEIDVPLWSWRTEAGNGKLRFSGAVFEELCVDIEVPKTLFDRVYGAWTDRSDSTSRLVLVKLALFDGYDADGTHVKPAALISHDGGRSWSRSSSACAGGEAAASHFVGGAIEPPRHHAP